MRKILSVIVVAFFASHAGAQSAKQIQKLSAVITPADLKAKLSVIASAEMEGRETATAGQKKAAAYIENYFKELGLQPGTPDGYQLHFPVYQDSVTGTSFKVNGYSKKLYEDYVISPLSLNAGDWSAKEIVFAGFGIVDSSKNEFKANAIKDKWVMVADGLPADASKPAGAVQYGFRSPGSLYSKIMQARSNEAAGVIIISKDLPPHMGGALKGNMYLKKSNNKSVPVLYVTPEMAATILGKPVRGFASLVDMPQGKYITDLSFSCSVTTNNLESSDVIGVLPGTDKKDEYVFITGHYDHLGKKDSVIWYGADDDGSGTTSVLELAKAFTAAAAKGYKPRRTMVFMTVSGEEKGLWGSDYYTSHPVFPLDKTSVDLNIDMVGRIDPERNYGDSTNYVYTIGEDKLSTDLMPISDSINKTYMHMELDRKYNDPKDPNRFYYRSDHFNFAKNGVPVIFYFNGTHADYHKPTDTVDKINFDLMSKRVHLVFFTAWQMANRNDMLKRDIPLK